MSIVKGPDNEEFRLLVEEHQTPLLRLCFLYLHDAQLAEDAVQETFLKALRGWADFRGEASRKTWLTRIAIRTCCDMRRTFWFRHMDRRVTPDCLPEPIAPVDENDQSLTLAVMRLPRKLREAVLLYYYQEMPVKEVAAALGISQPSVSDRLRRAREKLKDDLKEDMPV